MTQRLGAARGVKFLLVLVALPSVLLAPVWAPTLSALVVRGVTMWSVMLHCALSSHGPVSWADVSLHTHIMMPSHAARMQHTGTQRYSHVPAHSTITYAAAHLLPPPPHSRESSLVASTCVTEPPRTV